MILKRPENLCLAAWVGVVVLVWWWCLTAFFTASTGLFHVLFMP
jgi:hypothetical protein